mmetsp:Transcript_21188/g.55214  ORF Transcript_21188/g.55214 Transcript_21188/m.55214 type:complete len:358 (-) Transcript_21188:144-1217(-)
MAAKHLIDRLRSNPRQGALFVALVIGLMAGVRGWYLGLWPFSGHKKQSVDVCPGPDFLDMATPRRRWITGKEFLRRAHAVPKLPNGVPKIVHQTWMTHVVSATHARPFESWEQCLPEDWVHVLWSDAEADQLVLTQGSKAFLPTYLAYSHPIQKVDSFRYVLLDLYGGIYADLDNECMGPPEIPRDPGCSVFLAEQFCEGKGCREDQVTRYRQAVEKYAAQGRGPGLDSPLPNPVQNSLMISTAGNKFWNVTLDLCVERGPATHSLQRFTGVQAIQSTTGVDMLSMATYLGTGNPAFKICELPWTDWHGHYGEACLTNPSPRFVRHHGSHVWKSASGFGCMLIKILTFNVYTHHFCG